MTKSNTTVLVFSPHPDDGELFCGGTIAKLTDEQVNVIIVDLTRGELSSRGNTKIRNEESTLAGEILGIQDRLNLELPDGGLGLNTATCSREEQVEKVSYVIRSLKPETVFYPHGENRHPDHSYSSSLIREAIFKSSLPSLYKDQHHSVQLSLEYMMRLEFAPSIVIDVSGYQDVKDKAIHAYESQVLRSEIGGEHQTLVSDPLSISSIKARDSYFGSMIGVRSGEPFLLRRPIGVNSLSDFLQEQKLFKSFIEPRS